MTFTLKGNNPIVMLIRNQKTLTLLCLVAVSLYSSACRTAGGADPRFVKSREAKQYEIKGEVISIDKAKQSITVAHEDIPELMPAMTMPFVLRDAWPLEVLAPGDQISATLIVDGIRSWLEDVVITKEGSNTTSASGNSQPEAKAGDDVPNFALLNQSDKSIRIEDYRGKSLLLTFIYTRCPIPEYCTLMSNNFAEIDRSLQQQPELYAQTHLLSVSIDPDYDTPKVLSSYGAAHTGKYSEETFSHWEFATGTKDQVKGIAQFFGLRYFADKDQIVHGLRTVIIGPEGKVLKVYRGNEWKPAEVVAELQKLAHK